MADVVFANGTVHYVLLENKWRLQGIRVTSQLFAAYLHLKVNDATGSAGFRGFAY